MSDLISRQAALEAVRSLQTYKMFAGDDMILVDKAVVQAELEILPPVQERKKGEWISHEDEDGEHYGDKCSECGEWYVMPYGKTNYCPNCGADMRGETDE